MLNGSRRVPDYAYAQAQMQDSMARQRSRSIGGPIAVPLGTAYSEPERVRPPHRRSASSHGHLAHQIYTQAPSSSSRSGHGHGYDGYSSERDIRGRRGSLGRLHPEFATVVPADIGSDPYGSRGRASSRSREQASRVKELSTSRPPNSRRQTWQGKPSTTFVPALKVHRALAYSQGHPAVLYDVTRAPAHDNIFAPPSQSFLASITRRNRAAPTPVAPHTLALPATRPFVPELTLALPPMIASSSVSVSLASSWAVKAVSMGGTDPAHTALTNMDVLHSIYKSLRTPVSRREWDALGAGSSAQKRIAEAYTDRCRASGNQKEWDAGVRRVDFLVGRTLLQGVECRPDGACELVFARA